MTTAVFATDIHGNKSLFEKLFKYAKINSCEVIIGGDICPKLKPSIEESIIVQRKFLVEYLIPRIEKLPKLPYIMMGNDDCRINLDVLEAAAGDKKLHLLHNKSAKLGKYALYGYSFVPITPFRLKDWERADMEAKSVGGVMTVERVDYTTIAADFKKIAEETDPTNTIYSIHTPPFNTNLDVLHDWSHVGSRAVYDFIETEQPLLTLHGHIHESPRMSGVQVEKLGHSVMVNPGSYHHPAKPLPRKLPAVFFSTDSLPAMQCLEL